MRVRVRFPQSGLVMVGLVIVLALVHTVGPALALPAGGPFPSGSFQIQWTYTGTCVGVVHASEPGDPYRHAPVVMEECKVVPEQTWRYDRGQHHLMVASTQAGPCAEHTIRTVDVERCTSTADEQWALTADGAIIGGDLPTWGEVVTGIPQRGCWQTYGGEIDVTACQDDAAQRWRAVPVSRSHS